MGESQNFDDQEFPLEPPKPDWPRARGKECVLVAEDSEALRDLMLAMLSGLGYEVLTAGGGHEALRQIEKHHGVDLVITDAIMPKGGGFQIVDEVRERWPGTPVVITSGFTEEIEAGLRERLEGPARKTSSAEDPAAEAERPEAGTETEVEPAETAESVPPLVEFMPKPFRPEELARRVREILDRAKSTTTPRKPR
jgi:CheY-like chemotaxis protein